MAELTRRSNVAPFAAIHCNTEEAQISGYKYDSCLHQSKHMWLEVDLTLANLNNIGIVFF